MSNITLRLANQENVVIHDANNNNRFDAGDSVEQTLVNGNTRTHNTFTNMAARNFLTRHLGLNTRGLNQLNQVREFATHSNAAHTAYVTSNPNIYRDVMAESGAAFRIANSSHTLSLNSPLRTQLRSMQTYVINQNRTANLNRINTAATNVLQRLALGTLRGQNASNAVEGLNIDAARVTLAGEAIVGDVNRLNGFIHIAEHEATSGNTHYTLTSGEITEILNRYNLPTTRLEELTGIYNRHRALN